MQSEDDFPQWYQVHHPRLVTSLTAMAGNVDWARDATDEAFARALERWSSVRDMASPAAWTYRVALNALRRRQRRAAMERRLLGRTSTPTTPPPDPANRALWDAVAGLPDRQKTAVALRYIADLPEAAVASVMGVAPGTVSATLHAARRRLADELRADFEPAGDRHV